MKLNPKKCTFGAEEGMFLGHVVNVKGIKACPDKAEAVIRLPSPKMLKEVQSLNEKLAMDARGEKGVSSHEAMHREEADDNCNKTQGGADHLPLCSQGGNQCGLANRERLTVNASVLCQSRLAGSRNGSSCLEGSGARPVLTNPEGIEFTYALRFEFEASNNEAEYEALIARLSIAEQMGVKNLEAKVDSRLVVNQINRSYVAKEQSMIRYLEKAKTLTSGFKKFFIEQVPRSENKKADTLSKITSTSFAHLTKQVLVETARYQSKLRKHGEIISDNGKQFRDNPFKDWCETLNIKQKFTSIKHPQTNGQVERDNRSLGEGIKARLGEDNNWVEEVPHVLWAHLTTIKTSNGHTPFSLTYDTEAVIPVEIGMPSLRCEKVDQDVNDEALLLNLDILEEVREKAAIQEAKSKSKNGKILQCQECLRQSTLKVEEQVRVVAAHVLWTECRIHDHGLSDPSFAFVPRLDTMCLK
ncbi:reverse transcriptase domain-containing protein [Tanacetum coccineum]